MLGITIAIASAMFMAGMYILLKKSYKELDPSVAFFFDAIFGLVIWIPVGFIFGAKIPEIRACLPYAIISAILSEALPFYALSKGKLSVATVMIATYPIYTVIFSYLINREILTPLQIVFVFITIIGTVLTCIEKDFNIKNIKNMLIIIPVIAAISIGLSDTLTKTVINQTSSFSFLVAIALVQVPVALIYLKIKKEKLSTIKNELISAMKNYKFSIWGSFFNIVATGMLLISFNYTLASIASPLTAMYTPIVLVYAFLILKEKINKTNLVGIISAFIGTFGIILIS